MDSLHLGLLAVSAPGLPTDRRDRLRHERVEVKTRQATVLGWIQSKGLRRADIAERLGVAIATVDRVLNGCRHLPNAWVCPLADLLSVTPDDLRQAWRPWKKLRENRPQLNSQDEHARQMLRDLMSERRVQQKTLARATRIRAGQLSRAIAGLSRIPSSWYQPLSMFFQVDPSVFQSPRTDHSTSTCAPQQSRTALRRLMAERSVSQTQLAAALGHRQSYISMLLDGKRRFTQELAKRIATIFGVPVRSLWAQ
jgi:plasmid maintenance system antidote protein VapI